MIEKYEQMVIDDRDDLTAGISDLTADAISTVMDMAERCKSYRPIVRNRHEAYGIAAEHLAEINGAVKAIKNDTGTLLGTLSDPNYPALEAVSSICNSTARAAEIILRAAGEMNRTMRNLYSAENSSTEPDPVDEMLTDGDDFEEAEPADGDEE